MADKRILIASLCDECALNICATAPETPSDVNRPPWPGWVSISQLSTHDTEYRRESTSRVRLAWNALRARPAPWLHLSSAQELMALIEALEAAGRVAFPKSDASPTGGPARCARNA